MLRPADREAGTNVTDFSCRTLEGTPLSLLVKLTDVRDKEAAVFRCGCVCTEEVNLVAKKLAIEFARTVNEVECRLLRCSSAFKGHAGQRAISAAASCAETGL